MPHSRFNLTEVAAYLHITPANVEELVRSGEIPFDGTPANPSFLRSAIDAWASQRILGFNEPRLSDYHQVSTRRTVDFSKQNAILPVLMEVATIRPDLDSRTRASVLEHMVSLAESTDHVLDPSGLEESLLEREEMCSTALAGGVALLHPRHHDPYVFDDSFIVLGRTIRPIPFGAPDGERTDIFFLVCCDNDRLHLHVLARLCLLFYRTEVLHTLRERQHPEEMLEDLLQAERDVLKKM